MSTLSVPLTPHLEEFIASKVKERYAPSKAEVVRRAIEHLAEEEAINSVLRAEKEIAEGKILRGDLKELAKKFK